MKTRMGTASSQRGGRGGPSGSSRKTGRHQPSHVVTMMRTMEPTTRGTTIPLTMLSVVVPIVS